VGGVSAPTGGLLAFSTPRDPAQLAAFISLRILQPETEFWRRGLQAALAYHGDHADLRVPYGHRTPDGFPSACGSPASARPTPAASSTPNASSNSTSSA
jgi:hypothetical protein